MHYTREEMDAILSAIKTDIAAIKEHQRTLDRAMDETRRDRREDHDDLLALSRILRGENGRDSLLIRFALAEKVMSDSAEAVRALKASLEGMKATMEARLGDEVKVRIGFAQTVIVAVIAAGGGLVVALIQALLGGKT